MFTIPFSVFRDALKTLHDTWSKRYLYGAEIKPDDLLPAKAVDCSELVERIYTDGLHITIPDGAHNQYEFCRTVGTKLTPDSKLQPFDLIFLWDRDKIGQHIGHVAIVFGEMLPVGGIFLIEARGNPFNFVMFTPLDIFQHQFGDRVAGIYRIIEKESLREPYQC